MLITSRSRLTALAGASRLDLGPLPAEDALALLSAVAGAEQVASAPAAARSIAESCAGLPLALRIAGERLAARPARTVASLAARLADPRRVLDELATADLSVRASLDGACEAAPTATAAEPLSARHALCLLARLTTPVFSLAAAASALRMPEATAERLLDALIDAHLPRRACPAPLPPARTRQAVRDRARG